ncbi:MAG: hypothetical protein ACYCOU_05405 [Sulfobacillus sp.]
MDVDHEIQRVVDAWTGILLNQANIAERIGIPLVLKMLTPRPLNPHPPHGWTGHAESEDIK